MKYTKLISLFLLISLLGLIQFQAIAQSTDRTPINTIKYKPDEGPRALWDVQFNYDLGQTTSLGSAGSEYDGTCFWVTKWSTSLLWLRYWKNGTLRDTFQVTGYTGASNCRDLAFDGKFIWGGLAAGSSIVKIDTGSRAVVKTITSPIASVRAIAWDPVLNGLWICGWNDAIICVDTNGTAIPGKSIANIYAGKYGLAYDSYSPGGPFLWVFDQTNSSGGSGQFVYKYDLATLTYTGVSFDVTTVINNAGTTAIAGGLFCAANIVPGKATLGGVLQGVNDRLFGLELADIGPSITHTPLPNTENLSGPYVVNAVVTPLTGSTITSVKIYYSRNNTNLTDSVTMTNSSGNNWTGNIPGNGAAALYRYKIYAVDNLGRVGQTNIFQFNVALDTQKPVITHVPLTDCPIAAWPRMISATVTDNLGIDSVWVKWYKNTPTTIKHVKLLPQGGNVYQALFNSTQSEVALNDSIFYRIFAKDNSTAHNTDSTALYKFKFVPIVTVELGNGTTSCNFPFTTYWMDGRTDMLFLASEILAGGGGAGFVTDIGFNVITANSAVMNGFTINLQNTTATTLSGFVSTGWTVGYSGTYSVPGTGWQMITLQTPFFYNGTDNLLIEVCFNNSAYTQYSPVYSTPTALDKVYGRYGDLSTGNGCVDAFSLTTGPTGRPNTKVTLNLAPPVELTAFTSVVDQNNVTLNWTTATEKNNRGFQIERKSENGKFEAIGFVNGNGTSTNIHNYSFVDRSVGVGTYYYRLKQVDFNGTFEYFNAIQVDVNSPVEFFLGQNYPNPFNPSTTIKFGLATDSKVMLRVFDVTGQEVMTLINKDMKAGHHEVSFNASKLNSGVYFYKLEAGSFSSIKKMMLIK